MKERPERRLVYSSEGGSRCARCGWPRTACRCAALTPREEEVPARPTARLRIEKKGRAGKTVTIVDSLPRNSAFLDTLAQDLKKACGTGGSAQDGTIELQGDQRERIRALLAQKGFAVRG